MEKITELVFIAFYRGNLLAMEQEAVFKSKLLVRRPEPTAMTDHHAIQQLLPDPFQSLVLFHESHKLRNRVFDTSKLLGNTTLVAPFSFPGTAYEYKVTHLRECPTPESLRICDTPDRAAAYWRLHVISNPYFNQECECFAVLLLNTRRRLKGHHMVSIGTLDTILVHPREVFRLAVITCAAAIILAHNHPSGDSSPSEADIKVTRDLIRAGQILKIEVLDHIIIGSPNHTSLRELGYFY